MRRCCMQGIGTGMSFLQPIATRMSLLMIGIAGDRPPRYVTTSIGIAGDKPALHDYKHRYCGGQARATLLQALVWRGTGPRTTLLQAS